MHSATKQRPIDVIKGHLDAKSTFDIDVIEKLYSNYIIQHKDYTTALYKNVNKQISLTLIKQNEKQLANQIYEPSTNLNSTVYDLKYYFVTKNALDQISAIFNILV